MSSRRISRKAPRSSLDSYSESISPEQVKIIKELGHGMMGTVYLVSYKDKKYAMKVEHVLKEDIDDTASHIWNEINFAKDLANKYPEQFMTLYGYDFIDQCKLDQKYAVDLSFFSDSKQKYLKKLANSPYCVRKIYSLVDTTLKELETQNRIQTTEERYSMMIQLLYIIHLMHSNGYVHSDFHSGNVGVVNTNKNFINILGHNIPTFGRIYQAIDYGGVLNKNSIQPNKHVMGLEETEDIMYDYALKIGDKMPILMNNIQDDDFWNYTQKNNIQRDYIKDKEKILNLPESEIVKNLIQTDEDDLHFELFRILFPKQFQKALLGKYYDKVRPPKLLIRMEDMMIFFIFFDKNKMLIDYFASLLQN